MWTALVALYLELTTQTVDDDVEVKLTHTADHCLTCLLVCLYAECRVFLCKLLQAYTELVEVFLSLRLYCDTNHWIRELHSLECNRVLLVAECVACADIIESYSGTDITAADNVFRVLLV